MVTGSGLDGSRVPQSLGTGQKNALTAISWGWGNVYRVVEEAICKALYQFGRNFRCNDSRNEQAQGHHAFRASPGAPD